MLSNTNIVNDTLKIYLQHNFNLSSKEIIEITACFKPLILDTGNYFLGKGSISDSLGFIAKGVMRTYNLDDNTNDVTAFFFKENQFFGNLDSYTNARPSPVNIQAVTKCELLIIKKTESEKLCKDLPVWTEIFNQLIQTTLLQKITNQNTLRTSTAKEKYEAFLEKNGDIVVRVPLQYIASYLGITPQSLSRIRRMPN